MRRVILNFHGLGAPLRKLDPGEERYWVTRDIFSATLELAEKLKSRVETHITFDDGNVSDYKIAAPLLQEYGRKAQFFVLSSRIGQRGALGRDDILALHTEGHGIGSHGADHVDWRELDEAGQVREFDTARDVLSELIGSRINAAGIPFGRYEAHVLAALRSRDYTHVYSSDGGAWQDGDYPIPRTSMRNDMNLADIENLLLGHEKPLRKLRRFAGRMLKRWR